MDKIQKGVREFHEKHGLEIPNFPHRCSDSTIVVRTSLIAEEFAELMAAFRNKEFIDIVDALGDLIYVTYGTAVAMGVDMEPILREIHRSNMTKDSGVCMGKIRKGPSYDPPRIAEILDGTYN